MLPGLDPVFQGMVDMGGAEIGGEFYADKARFALLSIRCALTYG
jgi:hypothetical protein